MKSDLIKELNLILSWLYEYDSFSPYQNKIYELESVIDKIIKKDDKNNAE